ncbi:MAG: FAD-dependent monooxygenase [Chromatiales bacterium]|nr:FAD-dependent monooxygenase [Chromatiales bacterium]
MVERVIVVGAGPVGLTCAALLARAAVPVLVLEMTAARENDLRASTWHPPTLDMLDELGLAAPLVTAGLVSPTWQVRMHPSGERAVFDLAVLAGDTRHPYRLQCEQQVYCELLEARLTRLDGPCTLRRGVQVTGLAQSGTGVGVQVREADGTSAVLDAAWVIGADGARSVVRQAAGLEFQGSTYPETTILATTTFPFEQHLDGLSNVNYCWSADGTFSLLRLPRLWRVSLYADDAETVEQALQPNAIEAKLQRIVPMAGRYPVLEARPYRIHQRIVPGYRRGRVLLAGDAAHLNSPSGGMGMNGGLHDAFNLCAKLVRVWRGEDAALLDLYGRQRRPVAEEQILAQAHQNRTRMQERDPEKRRATLRELQAVAVDPARAREYLLRSSMITGLRQAEAIT